MINEHDLKDFPANEGVKFDDDKPPINLVDPYFIEGVANVLGFGAKKYGLYNWRDGLSYSRIIASCYRHLGAINKNEDLDPESMHPHVHHLAANVMFLAEMMRTRPDLDDRYKVNKKENNEHSKSSFVPSSSNVWSHTVNQLMETSKQMAFDF